MGFVLNKSETIGKLALALAKAQAEITGALTDSSNPFFKSKYADLASVMDAIRIPFSKNELAVTQLVDEKDGKHFLITMLIHSSGEYVTSTYPLVIKDLNNPQSIGSVVTYARRYTLAAIAGVAQVDDDGEAALGRTHEKLPNHAPKATNHIAIEANPKLALLVTEAQLKRLYAIQQKSKMSQDDVINFIKTNFQKNNSKELTMSEYDALIKALETF
jgi:hypothetical protein